MTTPDDRVSGYLDGALAPEELAAVESYCSASAEWQDERNQVAEVRAALRALPMAEPPAGFWDDVIAAVAADATSYGATARPTRHPYRWIGAGVAASVLMFAGAMAVPREREVRPPVAQYAEAHSARAGAATDPITPVAPVAMRASLFR